MKFLVTEKHIVPIIVQEIGQVSEQSLEEHQINDIKGSDELLLRYRSLYVHTEEQQQSLPKGGS